MLVYIIQETTCGLVTPDSVQWRHAISEGVSLASLPSTSNLIASSLGSASKPS